MRGCGWGGTGTRCAADAECPSQRCVQGWCASQEYADAERQCRDGPTCRKEGRCGAAIKESFFGTSTELECVAVSMEDCRASEVCATSGLCGHKDFFCVATAEGCARSARCEEVDECVAKGYQCVSDWSDCAEGDAPPGAPPWAEPVTDDTLAELTGGDHPSEVDGETLVCAASEPRYFTRLSVRLGQACPIPFTIQRAQGEVWFAVPRVRLRTGDAVMASLRDPGIFVEAPPALAKARVGGPSSLSTKREGVTLDCRAFQEGPLAKLARRHLQEGDKLLARPRDQRPDPAHLRRGPDMDDARLEIRRAASLLGWQHPDVAKRVEAVGAIERAWHAALGRMFGAVEAKASAARTPVELGGVRIEVEGIVCGDALRARWASAHEPGSRPPELACAVELRVWVTSETFIVMSTEHDDWGGIDVQLLRRTADGASLEAGVLADARLDDAPQQRPGEAWIEEGKSATVLVLGATPLALEKGLPDERLLIQAQHHGERPRLLKTDVPR
jgi:hypothetical protein